MMIVLSLTENIWNLETDLDRVVLVENWRCRASKMVYLVNFNQQRLSDICGLDKLRNGVNQGNKKRFHMPFK